MEFLLALAAWLWLASRLNRLENQIEAACSELQIEMAELVGNQDRAKEILRAREEDQAQAKKADRRRFWIAVGVIGAAAFAWWLYTIGQH